MYASPRSESIPLVFSSVDSHNTILDFLLFAVAFNRRSESKTERKPCELTDGAKVAAERKNSKASVGFY